MIQVGCDLLLDLSLEDFQVILKLRLFVHLFVDHLPDLLLCCGQLLLRELSLFLESLEQLFLFLN